MLDLDKVKCSFQNISGLDETSAAEYSHLFTPAAQYIEHQLTDAKSIETDEEALCNAAGALAFYYMVLLVSSREQSVDLKAGDMTISPQNTKDWIDAAAMLKDQYIGIVSHLFKNDEAAIVAVTECGDAV